MNSGRSRAWSAVQDLFDRPPLSDKDIANRLRDVDHHDARRALVARLQSAGSSERDAETLMALFAHLGVGEEKERVAAVVLDRRASDRIRAYACGLLASEDPATAQHVMDRLAPDERQAIFDVPFIDMLVWAQADTRAGEQLSVALDEVDDELRGLAFTRIEGHRQRVGTTAAAAYGPTLRKGRAPGLRAFMLEALVAEVTPDGIDLVRELRDGEPDSVARRALQSALLRMNTRAIEPTADRLAATGQGYLSGCDQHGDFVVIAAYENPDETRTVVDLCIRAGGELRGGFVLLRQSRDDVSQLLAELGAGAGGFATISLPEVARVVEDSLERTRRLRRSITPDLHPALALVSRTSPAPQHGFATPSWDAPMDRVRALLAGPGHDRAWLLSPADLEIVLASPPPPQGASRSWINQAARALGKRSRRRARLVDMAKHMAWWHQAKGELDEAGLCATLGHLTDRQPATSPLVIAMLERAFGQQSTASEQDTSRPVVDHALRNTLRRGPLAQVVVPKGKHLAVLDFSEAAYWSLRQAIAPTSTPMQLDDATRVTLAYDLAKTFVDESVGRKRPPDMERVATRMRACVMQSCGVDDAQAEAAAVSVLAAFASFLREVCAQCPIRCIDRARAGVRDAYFSQDHPAL